MSRELHVDVAILGAGTAGLTARRAALAEGASVVLIDPGPFGTTCARVGCMPSKLLIAAADAAHHARHADPFGVHAEVTVDGPAVMRRVQSERDRFTGFVRAAIDDAEELGHVIRERGTIVAPGVIEAGDTTVHYQRLILATGSTPWAPPPYRDLPADRVLTNEGIFEVEDVPGSVLVVGLGVVGLELGQALHRLGSRVTLLSIGGFLGPLSDPEVKASAMKHLGGELDLHPEHTLHEVRAEGDGVVARFTDSHGVEREETFEKVLLAAGRRPNLSKLGLEALGMEADDRGRYPIDPDTLQLGELPVFVAGDANSLHPLLHEAADDGRIAGRNAARFPEVLAPRRRTPLGVVFSDPQIAMVGTAFKDLPPCGASAGAASFDDQGRARVQRINAGHLRIYADVKTHRLLGAEMVGPRAEHIGHLLSWAVQAGFTVDQALDMPFYHPVVEEGVRTALRDLAVSLRARRRVQCEVSEDGAGA